MKKINKKKYDFIFSLGCACSCSNALRKCNFQIYSYPFDWLLGSDFLSRIELIKNNFSDWLNIEDMELIKQRWDKDAKNIYRNNKTKLIFSHDFPFNVDLEKSYEEVYEKYQRRIKRLYKSINKSKKVLVLYLLNPNTDEIINNDILIKGQKILQSIFPKQEIDIFYMEHKGTSETVNEHIKKAGYYKTTSSDIKVDTKEIAKILKENFKCRYIIINNIKTLFRIRKVKKGILINFLLKVNTIFRIKIYLFGLRFIFCIGKEREFL